MSTAYNSYPQQPAYPETVDQAVQSWMAKEQLVAEAITNGDHLAPILTDRGTSYPAILRGLRLSENISQDIIVVVDTDNSNEYAGIGIVTQIEGATSPYLTNKPYVCYTETDEQHLKRGFGISRSRIMNALCEEYLGSPLNSDPDGDTTEEARAVWLKLIASGEAEAYDEDGMTRYRFVSSGINPERL